MGSHSCGAATTTTVLGPCHATAHIISIDRPCASVPLGDAPADSSVETAAWWRPLHACMGKRSQIGECGAEGSPSLQMQSDELMDGGQMWPRKTATLTVLARQREGRFARGRGVAGPDRIGVGARLEKKAEDGRVAGGGGGLP